VVALYKIRKGQGPGKLSRDEFGRRYRTRFYDPAFDVEKEAIARLEEIAWTAYSESRKAPVRVRAGEGFADPTYELSTEWLALKRTLEAAEESQRDTSLPTRLLIVCASPRNDDTCPQEVSKTWRMTKLVSEAIAEEDKSAEVDVLDLSRMTSEYERTIYPCKSCVSTAMPLCHWPCTCYPNHSLGQVNDAMGEIYERWVRAHGIMILTPVHWYMATSPLKLMIDRLVCADGGNPDPTSTQGKDPKRAKDIELDGWSYPQHLKGRAFSVVVHGDVAGIEGVRRALCDWLEWMGLIDSGPFAKLDRFIGYFEPYATSHEAFDKDEAVQKEVKSAAVALTRTTNALRKGELVRPAKDLERARPK